MSQLVLIGGGEHAQVVAEAARLAGHEIRGCVAPQAQPNFVWLGDDHTFRLQPDDRCILAMSGDPRSDLRRRVAARHASLSWTSVIHPTAIVSPTADLSPGCFIAAGTIIGFRARVGVHAIINSGAQLDHDGVLADGAQLAPGAILGGAVSVGAWAFIGLGARIRDHLRIGEGATVGMGAVVLADVAPRTMVYGVPARLTGSES